MTESDPTPARRDTPAPPAAPPITRDASAPAAPPTIRDTSTPARRPFERSAGYALGLACGGLFIPLLGFVALGLGIRALVRISRSDDRPGGMPHAVIAIVVGSLGIVVNLFVVMTVWSMFSVARQIPAFEAFGDVAPVFNAAQDWADDHGGAYPVHVAEILLHGPMPADVHWAVAPGGAPPTPGAVRVGTLDLAGYGGTEPERDRLRGELDRIDLTTPTYRFGTVHFVRLPTPTGHRDLIFLWLPIPAANGVQVVTDDGMPRFLGNRRQWERAWEKDAAARGELGMPPLPMPPFPAP